MGIAQKMSCAWLVFIPKPPITHQNYILKILFQTRICDWGKNSQRINTLTKYTGRIKCHMKTNEA